MIWQIPTFDVFFLMVLAWDFLLDLRKIIFNRIIHEWLVGAFRNINS